MDKFQIVKQLEVVKNKIHREQWDIAESVIAEAIKYILHSKPNDDDEGLRDHFAGLAMQSLVNPDQGGKEDFIAERAYDYAEAMLRYRKVIPDSKVFEGMAQVDITKAAKNGTEGNF